MFSGDNFVGALLFRSESLLT